MANRHLGRACDHPELRTKPESGLAGDMRRHRTHEIQQLQEPRVHYPIKAKIWWSPSSLSGRRGR